MVVPLPSDDEVLLVPYGTVVEIDFLRIDWFELAELPLDEARARFCLQPKSPAAIAAGSVGPWEPGGISQFQLASGRAMADRDGIPSDPHGAALT